MTASLPTTCVYCDKRTNVRNRSTENPDLCKSCFEVATIELDHEDGDHLDTPHKDCPLCTVEVADRALDHLSTVHSAHRVTDCEMCDQVAEMDQGEVDPGWYEQPKQEDTTSRHFSHANCDHEKTAKARAKCRKDGAAASFHKA